MFITAVCVIFLIKLRWPKNKRLYDTVFELYGQTTLKIVRDYEKDLHASTKHHWILVSCKNASCSTSFLRSSTSNLAKKSFMKREHVVDSKKIC